MQRTHLNRKKHALEWRALTVVSILSLSAIVLLANIISNSAQSKCNALVVDVAGRQRMLTQRFMKEIVLASENSEADFRGTARLLLHSAEVLANGGEVDGLDPKSSMRHVPAAPSTDVREGLQEQKRLIKDMSVAAEVLVRERENSSLYKSTLASLTNSGKQAPR